jgi:CPA2 family monovalent cation:H+ antiporter-2
MGELVLRDVLIIFAVAIPIVLVAHRLNLPSIVGFLLTGIVIGPEGLGFISDPQRIELLAEVGVALLLFHIGLEFSTSNLKGMKRIMLGCGLVQVLSTIAAGVILGLVFDWPIQRALFFGCAASLSSTAIALAFLSYKRWLDSPAGRISTGVLVLQDLAIVPMLILLPFISVGGFAGRLNWEVLFPLVKIAAVFGVLWLVYRFVLGRLLHQVARVGSKELFIVILIGVALGFAWFTQQLGLSFALGAFLGGLMVSATPFRFHAISEMGPFRAAVSGLFFVSVGMLISPEFVVENLLVVASLVAFILIIKTLIATGSVLIFGYPLGVALVVGMILAQMGEFSFLLITVGFKEAVIGRQLYDLLISACGVTIVIAPIMMELSTMVGPLLGKYSPASLRRKPQPEEEELERLGDHAIICGFGPLGETIGRMLEKSGIRYVVLELNPEKARKLKEAKQPVYIGDGASAELLSHSGIERAKMLAIAVPDYLNALAIIRQARRLNDQITIITRSRYRDQVEHFYGAGADIVICEELEVGIEMGRYVLLDIGVKEEDVDRFISEVRAFGSADFF